MLVLDPEPSRALAGLSLGALLLGLVSLYWLASPIAWLAGAPLLLFAAWWEWNNLVRTRRICRLESGLWALREGAQAWHGRVHGSTVLTPWLIVLVLHDGTSSRRLLLVRDMLPSECWRRLRVMLRIQGMHG